MATEPITITPPETSEISTEVNKFVLGAQALVVETKEEHEMGSELLRDLTFAKRKVEDVFRPMKQAAHNAHKTITGQERAMLDPIKQAVQTISKKLTVYEREQIRIAEAEARRKADAQKRIEEEEALREAQQLAEAGQEDEAEAVLEAVAEAPTPVVQPQPEISRVAGVGSTTRWKAEVTSPILLVRHIANNPGMVHLIKFDQVALNSLARSQRESLDVPGVRAVSETSKSVRL